MKTQPDDQKARLNNALRSVFLRSGYAGASVARLAAATELGKASLYHYFPGGKEEMGRALVREAVSQLQHQVFSRLGRGSDAVAAICLTIDGFSDYVDGGAQNCLLAQFSQENAPVIDQDQIRTQFEEWHRQLASRFEDLDLKPKAAKRAARQLVAELYGHLLLATLLGQPKEFRRGVKRLKAQLTAQN